MTRRLRRLEPRSSVTRSARSLRSLCHRASSSRQRGASRLWLAAGGKAAGDCPFESHPHRTTTAPHASPASRFALFERSPRPSRVLLAPFGRSQARADRNSDRGDYSSLGYVGSRADCALPSTDGNGGRSASPRLLRRRRARWDRRGRRRTGRTPTRSGRRRPVRPPRGSPRRPPRRRRTRPRRETAGSRRTPPGRRRRRCRRSRRQARRGRVR